MRLHICTLLWDANGNSKDFSSMYDESWVEKLYRGFRRNLTVPFSFVCFVDRPRQFAEPDIEQQVLLSKDLHYGDCIEPYKLNKPMILCGLDTVVIGNIDHMAEYVLGGGRFALPRDPYRPDIACNGVALVPAGMRKVWKGYDGKRNDMEHVRMYDHAYLDDLFPGQIKSYKGHVKRRGWAGVKIVYFHGKEKPHELSDRVVKEHWR